MNKPVTILLVDDNKIDLYIHSEIIKSIPFVSSVFQYAFATQALDFLAAHASEQWPDVILLDIHMPIMNGFDFLTAYEKLPLASRQACKIIMLSSSLDNEDLQKARNNPMVVDFLEKPLKVNELWEMIRSEHD